MVTFSTRTAAGATSARASNKRPLFLGGCNRRGAAGEPAGRRALEPPRRNKWPDQAATGQRLISKQIDSRRRRSELDLQLGGQQVAGEPLAGRTPTSNESCARSAGGCSFGALSGRMRSARQPTSRSVVCARSSRSGRQLHPHARAMRGRPARAVFESPSRPPVDVGPRTPPTGTREDFKPSVASGPQDGPRRCEPVS